MMKNFTRLLSAALFAMIVFAQVPQKSFATVYTIDIALTGSQEVPPNPSTGLGNLTGTYDDVTRSLSFNLMFTGLVSPTTAAHFHAPAPKGVNAPVVIGLAGFPVGVFSGSYSNTYILTPAQNDQLLCGLWYINIHTAASPGGEIRGQLQEAPSSFDITLAGSQEVPPNISTGLGNLTGTYDDATKTLSFSVSFTGLLAPTTAAHFHAPATPGVNAPVVIGFVGFPVGVTSGFYSNSYVLTAAQETQLLAGLWYINIHTNLFPGGEIRGQLTEGTLAIPIIAKIAVDNQISCFGSCDGELKARALTGTPPFDYLWSTGSTTKKILNNCAGTYTVTVTDASGCSVVASRELKQPSAIVASHTKTEISAPGANDGSVTWTTHGATPPFTYLWSDGYTTGNRTNIVAGTYTITITDANGCTKVVTKKWKNPPVRMGDQGTENSITFYPNPTAGVFTIEIDNDVDSRHSIKVGDMQGRTVLTQEHDLQKGSQQIPIDMTDKARGVYMLHIINSSGTSIQKLILQ